MAQRLKIIPEAIPSETATALPVSTETFGTLPSEEQSYKLTARQMEVYSKLVLKAQRQKEINEKKPMACVVGGAIGGTSGFIAGTAGGAGGGLLAAGIPGSVLFGVKGAVLGTIAGSAGGCLAGIGLVDTSYRIADTYNETGIKGVLIGAKDAADDIVNVIIPDKTPQISTSKHNSR